ncbi:hypothetical protein GCM10018966_016370 [Streptomyces yanii]
MAAPDDRLPWRCRPAQGAFRAHRAQYPHALWLLLLRAAAGLTSVHVLDMVHRDLKPSDVMLTLDGLTLIDFGVARAAEQSRLTRTGMVVGTPACMASEQASGPRRLSGATDVFALGSVLAYVACGRPPFGEGFTTVGPAHRFGEHGHDGVNGATGCRHARRGVGNVLGAIRDAGCGVSGRGPRVTSEMVRGLPVASGHTHMARS